MSASCPPSTRSTSAMTVASPHSSRCSPSTHRSPGCVTACSGSAGASSSSVRPSLLPASSRSSSPSPKPISPRSKPSSREVRQLEPQQRLVPARVQRQLVVGQHIRPLLRLAHVRELDHRHPLQPELPCRQHPAVPGDDAALAHRRAPGWSSRTPGCWLRSAPPGHRSGCAGCAHTGSARPAAARRSRDRPSSGPHKVAMNSTCFYGSGIQRIPPQSGRIPPS